MPTGPYNVAGTLQDILAKKEADARQAKLDDLNQRNVESEMANREENTKSLADQRLAANDERYTKSFDQLGKQPDENVSNLNLSPEMQAALQRTGRLKTSAPNAIPYIKTFAGNEANPSAPAPPPTTQYQPDQKGLFATGSPDIIKTNRINAHVGKALEAIRRNPNMSPMEQMTLLYGATEEPIGTAAMAQSMRPTSHPVFTKDLNGHILDTHGKPVSEVPDGAVFNEVSKPTQFAPQLISYEYTDPKTHIKSQRTTTWTPGTPLPPELTGAVLKVGTNPPTNRTATKDLFPAGTAEKLASLRSKAVPLTSPGHFYGTNTTQPQAKDIQAFKDLTHATITYAQQHMQFPEIADVVRQYIDSDDPRSTQDIIASTADDPNVSPEELREFTILLNEVRPK